MLICIFLIINSQNLYIKYFFLDECVSIFDPVSHDTPKMSLTQIRSVLEIVDLFSYDTYKIRPLLPYHNIYALL